MSPSPTPVSRIVGPATAPWVPAPAQGLGAIAASPSSGLLSLRDKAKSRALCTNTQGDAMVMDGRSVGPAVGASPCSGRMGGVACGLSPQHLALLPSCFRRAIGNTSPAASTVPVGQYCTRQRRVGEPMRQTQLHCQGLGCPATSLAQGDPLSSSAISAHAELLTEGAASSQGSRAQVPMHGGAPSHPPLRRRPFRAGEALAAGPGAGWVQWARTPPGGVLPHARSPLPPALGHKSAWPWVLVRSLPPAGAPHLPAGSLSPGVLSAAGVPLISAVTF